MSNKKPLRQSTLFQAVPPGSRQNTTFVERTFDAHKKKIDEIDEKLKNEIVEFNKNYRELKERTEKNENLVTLGFLVIVVTLLGIAISFLEITMSYFNDKEESEYLKHRYISI